jgi:hypothetical protein
MNVSSRDKITLVIFATALDNMIMDLENLYVLIIGNFHDIS